MSPTTTISAEVPDHKIQKYEKDGCIFWEVVLTKESAQDRFGFVQANGKLEFEQRLIFGGRSARSTVSPRLESPESPLPGPEALVVRRVTPDSLLERWNLLHTEAAVHPHDRIISVNGKSRVEAMQFELKTQQSIVLTLVRYPERFSVLLSKEGGQKLGFRFEKPADPHRREITITQILPEGALPSHNGSQVLAGMWHFAVLADMCIECVNGVRGDAAEIGAELKRCETLVEMHIRREYASPPFQTGGSSISGSSLCGSSAFSP